MYFTLIQPGSEKSVNYQGPISLGLTFTRCQLTSPGLWQMRNRALRFRKSAQNGAVSAAQDQKLIGILTGAALHCRPHPGFSHARVVYNSSKTGWKRGASRFTV